VFDNAIAAGGQSNWSAYDGCLPGSRHRHLTAAGPRGNQTPRGPAGPVTGIGSGGRPNNAADIRPKRRACLPAPGLSPRVRTQVPWATSRP
jgi:hypothetical protein